MAMTLVLCGTLVSHGFAQEKTPSVGGHIGLAMPWVSHGNGDTTTPRDSFIVATPMGVTVRKNTSLPVDFGVMPSLIDGRKLNLTFAIAVGHSLGRGFGSGTGVLFDATNTCFGGAFAVNRIVGRLPGGRLLMGEVGVFSVLPRNDDGVRFLSVAVGTHLAVVF